MHPVDAYWLPVLTAGVLTFAAACLLDWCCRKHQDSKKGKV